MNFRRTFTWVFILLIFIVSGCAASGKPKLEKRDLVLEGTGTRVKITAELARTDEERSQGLMFRKKLADGEGMLFIFERDEMLSFWMKNTLIPLSIAYISSDGRIMEIHDMEPLNLNPIHSGRSVRYALEVPQGWFERVMLKTGDRLIIERPF